MIWIEGDKDFTVSRADGRIVTEGEINSARRQSDIIKHVLDFVRWNDFANGVPYLKKSLLGRFEARAGGCAHMPSELAGIDPWEENPPPKRNQGRAKKQHASPN